MSPDPVTPPAARKRRKKRLPPGLLRRVQAARFCAVAESTWDRYTAAGKNPAPVHLGGAVGWSRRELAAWIDHGCPDRKTWAPIWAAILTARRTGRPG